MEFSKNTGAGWRVEVLLELLCSLDTTLDEIEKMGDELPDEPEIPNAVRDRLAVATMAFIRSILKQLGGREALEARIALKR